MLPKTAIADVQQIRGLTHEINVFRALLQEAVDKRIDDDWLKRARKALAAQLKDAGDLPKAPGVPFFCSNCNTFHYKACLNDTASA